MLLFLSVVALSATSAQSFATFGGIVFDPTERPIPAVSVVLTNERTNSTYKVATDGSGWFEFVGLVPGPYVLQAMGPGFAVLEGRLTLTPADIRQDLRLEVGTVEETVTVTDEQSDATSDPPTNRADAARNPGAIPCQPAPTGGAIMPPMKIYDQRPAYPAGAQAAGIKGVVSVQGLIGIDGFMRDLRIVGTPPGELAAAALDAVGQWRFTPTLLNCAPIETSIKVTLKFGLSR
jgi:TonB family protein